MTNDRDEMELLLPWYVNGTLDETSRREIDAGLKTDANLRHALAIASEERDTVTAINEAINHPSSAVLDRILNEVEASGRSRYASAKRSMAEAFKFYLTALSPRSLAFAGAAVVVVLVLQAVTIGYQQMQGSGFGLASEHGTDEVAKGPRFIVKFSPNATLAQMSALMEKLDLAIVDGPKAGGLFILAARQIGASQSKSILEVLQANHDLITFSANASTEEN